MPLALRVVVKALELVTLPADAFIRRASCSRALENRLGPHACHPMGIRRNDTATNPMTMNSTIAARMTTTV